MTSKAHDNVQNFFQSLDADDQRDLFEFLSGTKNSVLIKDATDKNANAQMTEISVRQFKNETIKCLHKTGPSIKPGADITMTFEQAGAKFFASGKLQIQEDSFYEIKLKKLFKLQRRDSYRVIIPQALIHSEIKVSQKGYTLIDFSAGGCAFHIPISDGVLFEIDSVADGIITVGFSEPVGVNYKVKFRRKYTLNNKEGLHIGCEFTDTRVLFNQKMQALVNECQRQIIAQMDR